MGQLEKYGLYVLCLLIFLILGVTLWGSGTVGAFEKNRKSSAQHLKANGATGDATRKNTAPSCARSTSTRATGTASSNTVGAARSRPCAWACA